MAIKLTAEIINLFKKDDTTKVLATIDAKGFPHVVVKQSLQLDENGTVLYLELLESSQTNKNLVRSIWYDGKVSIILKGKAGESWQIKGKPVKAHITGALFQKHYLVVRNLLGDVDLAAVWEIEPEEVIDQSFKSRRVEEEQKHPLFTHLDRLAV